MSQIQTRNIGILGRNSDKYYTKTDLAKYIKDYPDDQLLEIVPRAFSKQSKNGVSRQIHYEEMYQAAEKLGREDSIYPFGYNNTWIDLVREPTNPYDRTAIRVYLRTNHKSPIHHLDGLDIGYVPMEISNELTRNFQRINKSLIKIVHKNVHMKYFICRISIAYDGNYLLHPRANARFINLDD